LRESRVAHADFGTVFRPAAHGSNAPFDYADIVM
jgi:hypothetical protein